MTTNDFASASPELDLPVGAGTAAATAPELGDVVDSLDDAAATFKSVVKNETDYLLKDVRGLIRDQPIASVAIVGTLAYMLGKLVR